MGKFAVIGLGNFGIHVTRALYNEGHQVLAIDENRILVQDIASECTQAIVMDAADKDNLESLGLEGMNGVILSVGNNISNSILICLYLSEIGVKRIIVKAIDEDHAKILGKIGATDIVHPEREMAMKLAKNLSHPNVIDFIPVSEDFDIIQLNAPKDFLGKTIKELDLRAKYNIHVIAVKGKKDSSSRLVPSASYEIQEEDNLIIVGDNKSIRKIKSLNRAQG